VLLICNTDSSFRIKIDFLFIFLSKGTSRASIRRGKNPGNKENVYFYAIILSGSIEGKKVK
jgi:hypothetical protein